MRVIGSPIETITNIAMIDGLPYKKKSCYNHFLDYGYNTYYIRNKSQRKKITDISFTFIRTILPSEVITKS